MLLLPDAAYIAEINFKRQTSQIPCKKIKQTEYNIPKWQQYLEKNYQSQNEKRQLKVKIIIKHVIATNILG